MGAMTEPLFWLCRAGAGVVGQMGMDTGMSQVTSWADLVDAWGRDE